MPDKYGFNHLGDNVRCIDCPTGGPIGRWPEHKRAHHGRAHGIRPKRGAEDVRRMRPLLATPPTNSNEEKEATTMATSTPKPGKRESAKQVAIDVLRKAGEPLHAKEIANRVLASGRCAGLKGKTPEATISAMLAVGSKAGGPFARVDKSTYTLANAPGTTANASETSKSAGEKRPQLERPDRHRSRPAAHEPSGRPRSVDAGTDQTSTNGEPPRRLPLLGRPATDPGRG